MVSRHLVRLGLAVAGLTLGAFVSAGAQAAPLLPPASVLAEPGSGVAVVPVQYGWGRHHDHGYRSGWDGGHRRHDWGHRHHGWGHGHHHHGHRHGGYRGYDRY